MWKGVDQAYDLLKPGLWYLLIFMNFFTENYLWKCACKFEFTCLNKPSD